MFSNTIPCNNKNIPQTKNFLVWLVIAKNQQTIFDKLFVFLSSMCNNKLITFGQNLTDIYLYTLYLRVMSV